MAAPPRPLVQNDAWQTLAGFTVPSEPGNERRAMERVAETVQKLGLSHRRLERLKTAVAEAVMNAMEHGNNYRSELPVAIQVLGSETSLLVRVVDQGGGQPLPAPETPDLEAKLASQQTTRGWGLFLIQNMVDKINVATEASHHTVELVIRLEGEGHASEAR